jgi:hypothetical protein
MCGRTTYSDKEYMNNFSKDSTNWGSNNLQEVDDERNIRFNFYTYSERIAKLMNDSNRLTLKMTPIASPIVMR